MTLVYMGIFALVYVVMCAYGIGFDKNKITVFDVYDSRILKGAFCIIIILVHIPEVYQNKIQDLMGSFAYIGVTFFFMTSSYGMRLSMQKKRTTYLRSGRKDCLQY